MANNNISVVPVTARSCRPFTLEVMVFSPESGYKFQVSIEKSCIKATVEDPPIAKWKLVFDLYKKKAEGSDFDQLVHVSYTAENPLQEKKVASIVSNGLNPDQSEQLITRVHPAVKAVEDISSLPADEAEKAKQKVKKEMSKTVDLSFT
ncbi:MAG: hypothetical protein V4714_11290 [Bacteroidota bacterium]